MYLRISKNEQTIGNDLNSIDDYYYEQTISKNLTSFIIWCEDNNKLLLFF